MSNDATERGKLMEKVTQAWHDQAARSLDAMHDRAITAETKLARIQEELDNAKGPAYLILDRIDTILREES